MLGAAVTADSLYLFTYNEESRDIGVHLHRALFCAGDNALVENAEGVILESQADLGGRITVCAVSTHGCVSINQFSIYAAKERQQKPKDVLLEDLSLATDEWLYLRVDAENELQLKNYPKIGSTVIEMTEIQRNGSKLLVGRFCSVYVVEPNIVQVFQEISIPSGIHSISSLYSYNDIVAIGEDENSEVEGIRASV